MTLTPFRGKCWTCGHDHDADAAVDRSIWQQAPATEAASVPAAIEELPEPAAWQWRKRHNTGTYRGEPYYVWSEWEPLVPPYMDARDLAKSDPQNYEVRALHAADQVRAIIAAERSELAKLKSDISAALKAIGEYDSELANQRERHEAVAQDAERWRYVVTHCEWIRHDYGDGEKYSSMSVRLPFDADQSCVATRTAAIDTAIRETTK